MHLNLPRAAHANLKQNKKAPKVQTPEVIIFLSSHPMLFIHVFCTPCPQTMQTPNVSVVTEFQLLGFQTLQEWQTLLFTIFLLIYLLTLTGNIVIIAVVSQDGRLHSPCTRSSSTSLFWRSGTRPPLCPFSWPT